MHAHPIPLIHLQKTSEFLLVTRLLQPFKNKLQNEGHELRYAQTPQSFRPGMRNHFPPFKHHGNPNNSPGVIHQNRSNTLKYLRRFLKLTGHHSKKETIHVMYILQI